MLKNSVKMTLVPICLLAVVGIPGCKGRNQYGNTPHHSGTVLPPYPNGFGPPEAPPVPGHGPTLPGPPLAPPSAIFRPHLQGPTPPPLPTEVHRRPLPRSRQNVHVETSFEPTSDVGPLSGRTPLAEPPESQQKLIPASVRQPNALDRIGAKFGKIFSFGPGDDIHFSTQTAHQHRMKSVTAAPQFDHPRRQALPSAPVTAKRYPLPL